jgi:hypothetical protein
VGSAGGDGPPRRHSLPSGGHRERGGGDTCELPLGASNATVGGRYYKATRMFQINLQPPCINNSTATAVLEYTGAAGRPELPVPPLLAWAQEAHWTLVHGRPRHQAPPLAGPDRGLHRTSSAAAWTAMPRQRPTPPATSRGCKCSPAPGRGSRGHPPRAWEQQHPL